MHVLYETMVTHLENIYKVLNDGPVILVEFILSQLYTLVRSNLVNCCPVREHELHHVVCGVPARHDITRDEPFLEI